ncbi:cysteine hydrolase family protein [Sphingomonas crocodyli]|uniref:Cysteine hydrolase n=1 Tax=Sphingomonas crocodyli TaxID=1979270 RepID=A0A437LZY9_9SPHN|nr:isochorismatase family cysteine hydrolase [Sphingomonas crocodyli]RVT90972.1 cysteine hydrolase [Sphingomonas crocodyli]
MTEPAMLLDMADRFDARHCALVIVDMQKDFCLPGFGAAKAGRDLSAAQRVAPVLAGLLAAARQAGVFVAHVGFWTLPDHASDSGPWLAQRRRSTASADNLCIADTEGADFIDELAPIPGEGVVRKHRYSAFTGTDLDLLLRARGIRSLVIGGVSTNACIESTLRAGFELDYYICVPPEAVGSWSQPLHEATLANVDHRFGVTLPASQVEAIWARAPHSKG